MSFRSLLDDLRYAGTGGIGRLGGAWASASSSTRRAILIILAVILLAIWLLPKAGIFGTPKGGFTDEELRLIEGAGTGPSTKDTLPWWYKPGE